MKQRISILLCLILVLHLTGCAKPQGNATFYYPRNQYLYYDKENVIVAERRDIGAHSGSISYLLTMYLVGPEDEALDTPFPGKARLSSASVQDDTLVITLTELSDVTDARFTLGCACLALTAMEAFPCETVSILCAERTITINKNDLLLQDYPVAAPTEETQ